MPDTPYAASGFSDEERAAEEQRRRAANTASPRVQLPSDRLYATCLHCGRNFDPVEGYAGDVALCDGCLHRD